MRCFVYGHRFPLLARNDHCLFTGRMTFVVVVVIVLFVFCLVRRPISWSVGHDMPTTYHWLHAMLCVLLPSSIEKDSRAEELVCGVM